MKNYIFSLLIVLRCALFLRFFLKMLSSMFGVGIWWVNSITHRAREVNGFIACVFLSFDDNVESRDEIFNWIFYEWDKTQRVKNFKFSFYLLVVDHFHRFCSELFYGHGNELLRACEEASKVKLSLGVSSTVLILIKLVPKLRELCMFANVIRARAYSLRSLSMT